MNYNHTEDCLLNVDGMQFGRMVKAAPSEKEIPVVLCSDWSDCMLTQKFSLGEGGCLP